MAQTDIDKILEDIKKRKAESMSADTADKISEKHTYVQEISEKSKENSVSISEADKDKISQFINNTPENKNEDFVNIPDSGETIKKSEDFIDENFKNFFTQSVVVTKSPEETNVKIKRKGNGFFKRKYITDSLSLNANPAEEAPEKEKKSFKKQDENNQQIVKRAGDVWAENNFQKDEEETDVRQKETETTVADVKNQKPQSSQDTEIKHLNRDTDKKSSSNLRDLLADDTDAESLAEKILQLRKSAPPEKKSVDVEPEKKTNTPPAAENNIVNSIFTSVMEQQTRDKPADDVTAIIPEISQEITNEETETESTKNIQVTAVSDEKPTEEVFEKYISKSEFFNHTDNESQDIVSELSDFRQTLSMRIFLGGICSAILTYFNLAVTNDLPMPAFISPAAQPMMFYIVCAVIYAIALTGFLPTIISGFKSLKGDPAPDSFLSLGAVLAAVQHIMLIATSNSTDSHSSTMFSAFICAVLAFNAVGKRIATITIIKNLSLSNAPSGINAGYIITDSDAIRRLSRTLDEKLPQILVSRKTGAITNFVNAGFSIHKSDYLARKTAIGSYVVTAICFVWALAISKNIFTAFYCAAGAAAIQIPLSQTLVNSVPSALMRKSLEKVGAIVNGWQGIDQLSKTTHVNFDAKHLFPHGTVILHGIKTFEKERIDLAIIYAASVLIEKCDVLRPVFMEVIEGKTDILYPVDSCEYIECQGYISWINNNRVIVGNRTLMEKYDVPMPPVSLESKFTAQGKKPVYLAVGGKLFGMFVLSYTRDKNIQENLNKLIDKGVSIILSSSDFNIDSHLIEEIYHVPSGYVSVLNQKESALLEQFTKYTPSCETCMAHLDSLHSLVSGFYGAESAKSAESVCSAIQTVSVIIGAILALLFTYSQTISVLPITSVLLLSFGWMGLSMIAAFAKKY